ncbi:hypothetical protein PVAP13_4NG208344 [Panicum virgatum]|uniref:Uncharacterized protein n=1 Tax=Panicum virgatum TaxID=38727 RepID=A0A8T0T4J5_PANVG|nr:hypothetical protein PVAP13_4NG208344 [Panicum virgatum]
MAILLMSPNSTIDDATWMNFVETDRSSFFTVYFSSTASPSSRIRPTSVMNFPAKSSTDSASLILRLSRSAHKDWTLASQTRSTPTCMERSASHTFIVSSSTDWEMIERPAAPHALLVHRMNFILIAHAA